MKNYFLVFLKDEVRVYYKVFNAFVEMLKDKSQFKSMASILGIKD